MNLKNPDAFCSWLIRQLEPICKANPEPVSKYVCALLKKERSDGELKNNLISQLMIFLHSATEDFVNFLIDALEGDKYLTSNLTFCPRENNDSIKEDDEEQTEENVRSEPEIVVEKEKERKSPSPIQAPTPSPPKKLAPQRSSSPRSRRNRFRNERRRAGGGGARKSRRDNSSHSDSPTSERRTVNTRKRSASGSSESSTKSPRRSWIASRTSDTKKYKHRNFARSPLGQRDRSTSPKLRGKRKPQNGNFRKRPRPNSRSNSDDERIHIGGKRVPSYHNDKSTRDLAADTDMGLLETGFGHKQRCIDFESKGYCARGDMCPYDHGPSPIVLDNNLLNGIVPLPSVVHAAGFADANLYTPQYVNPPHFPPKPFRPDNPAPMSSRELISVPTVPLPQKMKNANFGKPSYGHIFSSLPPGVSQTTIELTNVPAEQNSIPNLYETLSIFGNITLIQAKRNGDANTALLTYTNATEAALAFINVSSTIPNAKAAWYADKCILKPFPRKSIPASNNQSNSTKAFLLKRAALAATSTNAPDVNKTNPPAAVKTAKPTTPTKAELSPTSLREKAQEIRRKDPENLLSELIRKKHNLLQKQLSSRKEVLDKMKSLEPGSSEEKTWQAVLEKLNDVVAENEKSLKESIEQRREYLQKCGIAPVDSETLDIINRQRNELRNQQKRAQVPSQPTTPHMNSFLGESEQELSEQSFTNDYDGDVDSTTQNHDVDDENESSCNNSSSQQTNETRSPPSTTEFTRVVVSGFENGDEEELIQHFSQFGKILDKEIDNAIPSATLIYDNRKSAEEAKRKGRNFQDRLLSVTVFASKKYMPTLKRSTSLKTQEYTPYNQFSSSGGGGGGNPYKYKNPQMTHPTPVPRAPVSTRNVYSYRAEQKNRLTAMKNASTSGVDSSTNAAKMFDDEDTVTFVKKGDDDENT